MTSATIHTSREGLLLGTYAAWIEPPRPVAFLFGSLIGPGSLYLLSASANGTQLLLWSWIHQLWLQWRVLASRESLSSLFASALLSAFSESLFNLLFWLIALSPRWTSFEIFRYFHLTACAWSVILIPISHTMFSSLWPSFSILINQNQNQYVIEHLI